MLQYCVYLLYRGGIRPLNPLPLRALFLIGQVAGEIVSFLIPRYRALALRNVEIRCAGKLTLRPQPSGCA